MIARPTRKETAMFGLLRPAGSAKRLTANEAVDRHARGEMTVIDVREVSEVRATGTGSGVLHIPLALLGMRADPRHPDHVASLNPDDPVALFCASGGRSEMAAGLLRKLGYKDVHNIGGFGDWCAAGGKVAHPKGR
jgi:rhodanese-related sulfurtransferase